MQKIYQKNEILALTGLSAETLRYYEKVGLIDKPSRSANGYRLFNDEHLLMINFIKKCRSLGFSVDETKELCQLKQQVKQNPNMDCTQADDLVKLHLTMVDKKITELMEIRAMLTTMSDCTNEDIAHCKVIEGLN